MKALHLLSPELFITFFLRNYAMTLPITIRRLKDKECAENNALRSLALAVDGSRKAYQQHKETPATESEQ